MATHSSTLAWKIPWTEEPGGLLSTGLHRVRHDWSDLACMHALEKEVTTHSCLENPRDGEGCSPGGLEELDTAERLHFHALEKEMATHSSVLAWRIPGTGEPSGLPSMGSHRVRHDWSNLAAVAAVTWPQNLLHPLFGKWITSITTHGASPVVWILLERVVKNRNVGNRFKFKT